MDRSELARTAAEAVKAYLRTEQSNKDAWDFGLHPALWIEAQRQAIALPAAPDADNTPEIDMTCIPRRNRVDLQTPAEAAIRAAIDYVEGVGAHYHLTRAVVLLGDALNAVADFVDGVPEPAPAADPLWPPKPDRPAPEGATFEKGATLREDGCFNAYTIDVTDHGAKIQVFGDPELRDRILRLLQNDRDAEQPTDVDETATAAGFPFVEAHNKRVRVFDAWRAAEKEIGEALGRAFERITRPMKHGGDAASLFTTAQTGHEPVDEINRKVRMDARADAAREAWQHGCDAICQDVTLWTPTAMACPHCGRPAPFAAQRQEVADAD